MEPSNNALTGTQRRHLELVAEVLERDVQRPLAALRASLDALARRQAGRREAPLTTAALEHVVSLSNALDDLADLATPPPIRPLRCSVEEIARGALDDLEPELREHVLFAFEPGPRLFVDGPLLSRCLAHAIRAGLTGGTGLAAGAQCMLRARETAGRVEFAVVHARTIGAAGLGLELARRDLARMGATLAERTTSRTSAFLFTDLCQDGAQEAAA